MIGLCKGAAESYALQYKKNPTCLLSRSFDEINFDDCRSEILQE